MSTNKTKSYQPHLSAILRGLMTSRGVSIRTLASDTGLSTSQISNLRAGTTNPTIDTLRIILDCLDASTGRTLWQIEEYQDEQALQESENESEVLLVPTPTATITDDIPQLTEDSSPDEILNGIDTLFDGLGL